MTGANGGIVCDSDKAEPDCSESLAAGTPVPLTATPKTPGAAPVTSVRAVFVARVNPHASYGQYLARIDQPTAGYDQAQLRRRGALFDFRVRIEGFKHRSLLLKWELFDNVSGDEVDQSKDVQITPTNQTNEATWQFWVPILRQKRAYVAVVELLEQKKTHQLKLSSLETKALRSSG